MLMFWLVLFLFLTYSDQYHCPEQDSNLGPKQFSLLECEIAPRPLGHHGWYTKNDYLGSNEKNAFMTAVSVQRSNMRAVLKRSKNFCPSAVRRPTMPFAVRLPSDRQTVRQ